jgi:hypothetical protein
VQLTKQHTRKPPYSIAHHLLGNDDLTFIGLRKLCTRIVNLVSGQNKRHYFNYDVVLLLYISMQWIILQRCTAQTFLCSTFTILSFVLGVHCSDVCPQSPQFRIWCLNAIHINKYLEGEKEGSTANRIKRLHKYTIKFHLCRFRLLSHYYLIDNGPLQQSYPFLKITDFTSFTLHKWSHIPQKCNCLPIYFY